jgi:hypothetical protein
MDCVSIDKGILLGTIRKEEGTLMLFDLLDYVKSDVATMDKETWEMLVNAEKKILEENEKRKDELFKDRRVRDSSEKRELELSMLREDYQACKAMLYFIQNLAFKKGWFQ